MGREGESSKAFDTLGSSPSTSESLLDSTPPRLGRAWGAFLLEVVVRDLKRAWRHPPRAFVALDGTLLHPPHHRASDFGDIEVLPLGDLLGTLSFADAEDGHDVLVVCRRIRFQDVDGQD